MRYEVARDFGGKEKETRREYNARFGQPTGEEIDIPDSVEHVWGWFWQLSSRRSFTDSSLLPLSFTELDAWTRLMRVNITPEDLDMLIAMDDAMLSAHSEESQAAQARADARKQASPKPKR